MSENNLTIKYNSKSVRYTAPGEILCDFPAPGAQTIRLQKEFQCMSYDLLIRHTTIVFSRYIVLSWQNRCHTNQHTLGGIFYDLCDEVNELVWAVALLQLIKLLEDVFKKTNKMIQKLIKSQL